MANLPLPRYATAEELEPIRAAALAALQQTVSITWAELKALRDAGSLVPGASYRITDYVATVNSNYGNTGYTNPYSSAAADRIYAQSANHQFDIIVTAVALDLLGESARAIQHAGDTYFAGCNLAAWQIMYCLDNDSNRFAWADTANGKGVIYRMVDEWYNDLPYDFKSIQFKAYGDSDNVWRYTFDSGTATSNTDLSLDGAPEAGYIIGNTIKELYYSGRVQMLNGIVFKGRNTNGNVIGCNCASITFKGANHADNFLGDNVRLCVLGQSCHRNTIYASKLNCVFGSNCSNNIVHGSSINLGSFCESNIVLGSTITLGDYCSQNQIGTGCSNIILGASAASPKSYCRNITFEPGVEYVTLSPTGTTSSSAYFQNVTVKSGVKGASANSRKTISDDNVGQTFHTTFKPANSQEVSV